MRLWYSDAGSRPAVPQGKATSELVESAIRALLRKRTEGAELPPLPVMQGGGALIDISDREALYSL